MDTIGTFTPAKAFILHTATGATRRLVSFEGEETNRFVWEHGNFSCDCNRHLFWAREANEPEDDDLACSDGAWRVAFFAKDNSVLFSDMPEGWALPQ